MKRRGLDAASVLQHYGIHAKALSGTRLQAWCPFHHDQKTASLSVDLATGLWTCFGCGASGNLVDFVARIEDTDDFSALLKATDISHDERVEYGDLFSKPKIVDTDITKFQTPDWDALYSRYSSNGTALVRGRPQYVFSRGLRPQTLRRFGVRWDERRKHIVFPVKWGKKIVGFQRRVTVRSDEDFLPYLNSDGLPKHRIFYWTRFFGVRLVHRPLLVEGAFDVLKAYQYGWSNVLHGFGANLSDTQFKILERVRTDAGGLYVAFDHDENKAGEEHAERLKTALSGRVTILSTAPRQDVGEMTKREFWRMMS